MTAIPSSTVSEVVEHSVDWHEADQLHLDWMNYCMHHLDWMNSMHDLNWMVDGVDHLNWHWLHLMQCSHLLHESSLSIQVSSSKSILLTLLKHVVEHLCSLFPAGPSIKVGV